jgi:hypothetical protein
MAIDIRKQGNNRYTGVVSAPDARRSWSTAEAMPAADLLDRLLALGCHSTDIADAFNAANPDWLRDADPAEHQPT